MDTGGKIKRSSTQPIEIGSLSQVIIQVTSTTEFAKTWGLMKAKRNKDMTYEKMSRAMRYHYGCKHQGRKGHLAMVHKKRLYYKWVEILDAVVSLAPTLLLGKQQTIGKINEN